MQKELDDLKNLEGRIRQLEHANATLQASLGELKVQNEKLAQTQKELEEARTHERFLAGVDARLAQSIDYQTTLASVARLCVPYLADWCVVDIAEDDGSLARLAVAHADPGKAELARELQRRFPPAVDADHIVSQVVRTGQANVLTEVPDAVLTSSARDRNHLNILYALGIKSHMIVPLIARGHTLGAITFAATESGRRYCTEDLELAEELANRAALAVDNARVYKQAQEAVKARDEFLSIASHELRTPLTSLVLQLQSLQRAALTDRELRLSSQRVLGRLEGALGQTQRLTKLVNELLDVSRITAGRVELELEEVEMAEVVRHVLERFEDELKAAGCTMSFDVKSRAVGLWDRSRLDQVVDNLISNAVKYGRGKPIEVTVEDSGETARLTVRDYGIGILPQNMGLIFKRFERAAVTRNYGGLGLGLYIVSRILESLGGTIKVESTPGEGSLFIVELPLLPRYA